jgi:hypothetical protein
MTTGNDPMTPPALAVEGAGRTRIRTARLIAVAADLLQIAVFPLFAPGAGSPVNDALDVAVAGLLTWLVGWHWSFLPSFVAELVPGLDLVPTWTAAVLFATRGGGATGGSGRGVPRPRMHPDAIDAEVVSSRPGGGPAS